MVGWFTFRLEPEAGSRRARRTPRRARVLPVTGLLITCFSSLMLALYITIISPRVPPARVGRRVRSCGGSLALVARLVRRGRVGCRSFPIGHASPARHDRLRSRAAFTRTGFRTIDHGTRPAGDPGLCAAASRLSRKRDWPGRFVAVLLSSSSITADTPPCHGFVSSCIIQTRPPTSVLMPCPSCRHARHAIRVTALTSSSKLFLSFSPPKMRRRPACAVAQCPVRTDIS